MADSVARFFTAILESTHDLLACCKPQSAFFEALGVPGLEALQRLVAKARELGLPVVLDAKRGDIGSTAEAYAEAYLADGPLAADALTVNPFLGLDTLEPFIERAVEHGRGLFVLLRTSNPGSADLQGVTDGAGVPLYLRLARRLAARAEDLPRDRFGYGPLGAVVGAQHGEEARRLRELLPSSLFLVPGYGAQGGTAASVAPAFDGRGLGALVSASRSLTYADELREVTDLSELGAAVRLRVEAMRTDLGRVTPTGSACGR